MHAATTNPRFWVKRNIADPLAARMETGRRPPPPTPIAAPAVPYQRCQATRAVAASVAVIYEGRLDPRVPKRGDYCIKLHVPTEEPEENDAVVVSHTMAVG